MVNAWLPDASKRSASKSSRLVPRLVPWPQKLLERVSDDSLYKGKDPSVDRARRIEFLLGLWQRIRVCRWRRRWVSSGMLRYLASP